MLIQAGMVAPSIGGYDGLAHLVLLEMADEEGYVALCGARVALLLGDPDQQKFPVCPLCKRKLALRKRVLAAEPAT